MRFTKMHGLGNDFIVIDAMEKEYFPTPNDARRLCNRRTGIGADGLMLALPSQKADLRMRLLNSDGSTAEMCGNGIRCFAKFAYQPGVEEGKNATYALLGKHGYDAKKKELDAAPKKEARYII